MFIYTYCMYQAIASRSAPLLNCWGFIDGTAREICRPSILQQEYYSRHKHKHCLKYQGVLTPDGITVHLAGPYPGRRHDAGKWVHELYLQPRTICISAQVSM